MRNPRKDLLFSPVGFRRDGRPIYPIRGAEDPPTLEEAIRRINSLQADIASTRDKWQSERTRADTAERTLGERTAERDQVQQQLTSSTADVDRRIAEARTQAEQTGRDAERAEWQPKLAKSTAEVIGAKARQAALDAGVKPEKEIPKDASGNPLPDRVGRFLAMVDMQGITGDDGVVNFDELVSRVKNTATANPEFLAVGAPMGGGGNSGQGAGGGGAAQDIQLKQQVDANVAEMFRTLRIQPPATQEQAAGAAT